MTAAAAPFIGSARYQREKVTESRDGASGLAWL